MVNSMSCEGGGSFTWHYQGHRETATTAGLEMGPDKKQDIINKYDRGIGHDQSNHLIFFPVKATHCVAWLHYQLHVKENSLEQICHHSVAQEGNDALMWEVQNCHNE